MPDQYRAWVRAAVLACVVGYAMTNISMMLSDGETAFWQRQEFYALLVALVALVLERQGRAMAGAYLTLFAVSAEVSFSFYGSADGIRTAALSGLPVVVLGAGLLLGPRVAYGFAICTAILTPSLVYIGGQLGAGPGFQSGDIVYVSALVVCQLTTAYILHLFLRTFGYLLARSQANERRAADLLEAAPDGLLVVSPDGTIEACNEYAAQSIGCSRDKLQGMSPPDLPLRRIQDQAAPFDLEALVEEAGAVEFLAQDTGLALEARARRVASSDDRVSWLILLRDITERLLLRDITERHSAKKREEELAAQLQHTQKLEAVGQLAGGVAHDFNNILTVVAGYADFIEDMSEEGAGEIAEELRSTYQRGVVLTRQLLTFARREVAAPVPINLTESLLGLEKLLHRLVGEQVRMELIAEEDCPIIADAGQLEQVVINLAANARDAMPEGGALKIVAHAEEERVILKVTDSGTGIAPETQERIFDPFFTTKARGKGTGLGLSTVHGIVTQAGGDITVNSRLGEGTTFEISWPMSQPIPRTSSEGVSSSKRRRGQGLILLAEDDVHARKLIVRVLQDAGFEVMVAQDGAEALSMAVNSKRTPDLLLTDVVMPGMSGVELIERVTRLHPQLEYLVMSGYTDQQMTPAAFNISEDLIQKPFGREELVRRVLAKLPRPHESPSSSTISES